MNANPWLTIAIPTRNRLENLKKQLAALRPQLDSDCEVLVIDNDSDQYFSTELVEIAESFVTSRFRFIRNGENIGADANIVKCFEHATGSWLYVLGDSKLVTANCISLIRRAVSENPGASFVNFYFPDIFHAVRNEAVVVASQAEFAQKLDCFGNILLVGNSIYRKEAIREVLKYGYMYTHTHASQVAIAVLSLDYGPGIFSHEQVIEKMLNKPQSAEQVGIVECWLGFSQFPKIARLQVSRNKINKIIANIGYPGQPLSWLVYNVIKNIYSGSDRDRWIQIYKEIIFNMYFTISKLRFLLLFYLVSIWTSLPFNKKIFNFIINLKLHR